MVEETTGGGRIADIEVLRAIAVAGVVLHHANGVLFVDGVPFARQFYLWFGGWTGVDLFFVISGFVITRVLLPELRAVSTRREFVSRAGAFWIRRAFRLLPLAWVWLLIVLALAVFLNESGAFGSVRSNLAATLAGVLQYANWRFADSFGRYEYGASFVYWSLSLEEQFYLVLPLLMYFARARLALVVALVALLQIGVERGIIGMAFRTDGLCLGVLVAIASRTSRYAGFRAAVSARAAMAGVLMLLLLAAIAVLGSPALTDFKQRIGAIAVLGAVVVALAGTGANPLSVLVPSPLRRAMTWLGARSYAVYLLHVPTFFMVREIAFRLGLDPAGWPLTVSILTVALIALQAEASYRWVESPMRGRGRVYAAAYLEGRRRSFKASVEVTG